MSTTSAPDATPARSGWGWWLFYGYVAFVVVMIVWGAMQILEDVV
jgi:hypothetical protein